MAIFWAAEAELMRVKIWGARGSIPSPGPETVRYGGNTSCVAGHAVGRDDLVLDAGTGIRNLGELFDEPSPRSTSS